MATLRELIAKVVFRADPAQLKAFSASLDAAKTQLLAVEAEAKAAAGAVAATGAAAKTARASAAALGTDLGSLWKTFGGLGAAAFAYKALNFGKGLVAEADAVGELAEQLGISTGEFQTWSAFAERAGASNEHLTGSVKTLAKQMQATAETAGGPAAKAFKTLGISTEGWSKELPDTMDVLLAAGGALSQLENDAQRTALAQELLGEAGLKMLPGFKGGTAAAKAQLDMLRDLAVVYDEEFIKQADAASDEMDLFGRQLKGVGVQVLLAVLPALRDFVRWLGPVVKNVRNVVRDSNILTAAFGVLGSVGIGKLIAKFGGLTNLLKIGGRILLRFLLPFLILDDIITFLRGGKSVLGDILNAMFGMGAAKSVLEGIKAIWEGLSGTVKYFWGLMSGDQKAIDEGEAAILKFGASIADIGADFAEAWRYALRDISAAFEGWASALSVWLSGVWTSIVDGLAQMLADAVAKVKNFASDLPLIGGLFKSDSPADPAALARNAESGLALGGSPAVSQSKATNVTVTDNSTITTNLNGVDAKNVGTALRQSERNISAGLERSRGQVLRQTVGAAGT